MPDLDSIKKDYPKELESVQDKNQLEALRVKYLGRKGQLTSVLRSLKDLSENERKTLGSQANKLRDELQNKIDAKFLELGEEELPSIDITRPGHRPTKGHIHLLSKIESDIRKIFLSMNFSVVEGPEMETEFYNFDALNLPDWHPAREAWDTFWLKPKKGEEQKLLRTHTSPVQIRYMEKHQPPFQIIVPGRCFRYEATDATHETNFYQFEGLMVGKDVNLTHFKYIIEKFFEEFFKEQQVEARFRPSYFPFVEPGVEVDMRFKGGDWLEMMGAGMVHPHVFEAAHYNPREFQGFAFGMGIERLAMIKYKIPDMRMFYTGDLRFINQF
ncbi:MAG: phenylalanine--tRNA ligase subunit alpha [Candidatus Colwellbacteria bacterium CG10_big_fil_rev_8_21_14_0_10_42_22]|uniref:Phenylalanine--tRNA ligase alpha subunit n=1 Tax=Candidatus Colwellbacteria bacterium CG10_big_fil_rev_8_21_14_0_10_42_22 TaxID=1974540 RepID=A0A2H0VHD9_9BACT|nr:MAG: phenylalanine--tRNA ligase subunit alpha [Candidatus Colwellbacteria bacterium CG10_big_fil_rev_8_21_14_0_10_42_22]